MDRVKALYGVMQSLENALGGGEGVEGLYGSVNKGGMQKILNTLHDKCGLDSSSRLVDIGAGLGRPLMHALVDPGIASGFGVEIDRIKCDKAEAFLRQTVAQLRRRGIVGSSESSGEEQAQRQLEAPVIECAPVEQIRTLDPCTHAYSFWEGVPFEGKMAFGRLFAGSRTLRAVAVVQRAMRGQVPAEAMEELGFGRVALVDSFSVSMSGSGRSFTAYIFNRVDPPASLPAPLTAEQSVAEGVATPDRSQEEQLSLEAVSASESVQQEVSRVLYDSAAAAAVSAGVSAEPGAARQADAVQQPALGRGARRAARGRRAAEAEAAEAAAAAPSGPSAVRRSARAAASASAGASHTEAAAAAGAGGRGAKRGSPQKENATSPQKPRGVQKKQSPKKQAPVLLQDVRVRRPGATAMVVVTGKAKADGKAGAKGAALAQSPTRVRRGLLA